MRFQVRAGSRAGTAFEVDRNGVVLGRGADCDIVLDDQKASRKHARIQQLPDGRVSVQDLGSSNGTLVNGSPIQTVILAGAGTIQIGDTVIDAMPAAVPAAAFAAPSPQQVGPSGERLSRVQRLTPSVVQRMTPSTIQRVIKRRSRRGMIIIGSVSGVVIAGLVVALIVFSGGDELKPAPDKGDFQVQVVNASGDQANFQKVVIESGVVNEVVTRLNREISLPKNVPVILRPSQGEDDISPYWNTRLDRIEFPYLWVAVVAK